MRISRTERSLIEEDPIKDLEIQLLEMLLWDWIEGKKGIDLAKLKMDRETQEIVLAIILDLINQDIITESAPFMVHLKWVIGAMIRAGFYPEGYEHHCPESEKLLALSDKTEELIDSVGLEGAVDEVARIIGLIKYGDA